MRLRSLGQSLGLLALGAACHRYEYRRDSCPPDVPSRSAVAWQLVRSDSLTISGRVLAVDPTYPIRYAGVRLLEVGLEQPIGADGTFRLVVPSPGRYTLLARSIGYVAARAVVDVRGDSSVVALVALEQRPIVLDGCGYALRQVRKPWWKWW